MAGIVLSASAASTRPTAPGSLRRGGAGSTSPASEADGASASSTVAGTAQVPEGRTSSLMPNAVRPTRPHPARAGAAVGSSPAAADPASTTGSLPSAWGAAGQLLLDQRAALGNRSPINVALLESTAGAGTTASADLSAIWTLPERPGRPAARIAIRRLDPKGRLMLPVTLSEKIKVDVPAECDGPVLTLFLPGSHTRPALARVVAPLPLDSRGRLTVARATRTRTGWTGGTDILIAFNAQQNTVTLSAASVLEDSVLAALDALRPSTRSIAPPTQTPDATRSPEETNVHYLPTANPAEPPGRSAQKPRR